MEESSFLPLLHPYSNLIPSLDFTSDSQIRISNSDLSSGLLEPNFEISVWHLHLGVTLA